MKFTLSWLLEHFDTNANLKEITDKLTYIGLEVEGITDNSKLAGFVVAEVMEVEPHPNADKLKLCKVSDGNKILQIVCGAGNVRRNMKTVLASLGSTLPESDFTIKPTKIRGVLSDGMLCSASELALIQEESEGIMELSGDYKVGDKFFNCDPVIDLNITPNRGDCLGIYGIARDLSATGIGSLKPLTQFDVIPVRDTGIHIFTTGSQCQATRMAKNSTLINSPINVEVTDGESFISGRYIANVKNKESPKWLKDKLESIGMRSISAIVDITNYIMISFGRPMHAYDADKIEEKLIVRKAKDGEKFTALNGKEYVLNKDISIISDNKNIRPLAEPVYDEKFLGESQMSTAEYSNVFEEHNQVSTTKLPSETELCKRSIHGVAGIIGGKFSECTLETVNIFLESAWFDPVSTAKSSRQLGISTDSSYRFARSVDPGFTIEGLNLATKMIVDLCGGEVSNIVSAGKLNEQNGRINFDHLDINKLGNISASPDEISDILTKLGFDVDKKNENHWNVHVPSWRPDVAISADLVEEVTRIYGYDKIKEETLISNAEVETNAHDDLRILMTTRGFHEVLTWSFMSEAVAEKFGYLNKSFIIENPFNNNFNIMRPSVIPNLLQVAVDNIAHGVQNLAIFEIGPIYDSEAILNQPKYVLSGIRSGNNLPRNHYNTDRKVDIFDVKADLMKILEFFDINCDKLTIERAGKEYYHPGKSGTFSFKNKIIGYFGELHPSILDFFDIKQKVVGFEVILENIENLPINKKRFVDYKYQSVKRDFAFIVSKGVKVSEITNIVKKNSDLITEVSVFDVYQGNNIEPDKVSIALSVTFCSPTHTLTEEEIQKESSAIVNSVYESTGGVLR